MKFSTDATKKWDPMQAKIGNPSPKRPTDVVL